MSESWGRLTERDYWEAMEEQGHEDALAEVDAYEQGRTVGPS